MKLDHFAWAASSLEKGIDEFVRLGGPRAVFGGSHSGQGTCNALASLGNGIYLAIDAPDPTQEQKGTYGEVLSKLDGFDLNVFAIACEDLHPIRGTMRSLHIDCEIVEKSRVRPDGVEVRSSTLETGKHAYGKVMPHFMQWHTKEHPSTSAPTGCELRDFWVEFPQADELADLYRRFGLDVAVKPGAAPKLIAVLESAKERFVLPTV